VRRAKAPTRPSALVRATLAAHGWVQKRAARALGVTPQHLSRAIERLGLDAEVAAARRHEHQHGRRARTRSEKETT
jgi:hypothetical protein